MRPPALARHPGERAGIRAGATGARSKPQTCHPRAGRRSGKHWRGRLKLSPRGPRVLANSVGVYWIPACPRVIGWWFGVFIRKRGGPGAVDDGEIRPPNLEYLRIQIG